MEKPSPEPESVSPISTPALSVSEDSTQEIPPTADGVTTEANAPETTDFEGPFSVFPRSQKLSIIFIGAIAGVVSPFTGSIYLPALNTLATDLGVSTSLINLTVTSYQVFQGLAPSVIGTLSDVRG